MSISHAIRQLPPWIPSYARMASLDACPALLRSMASAAGIESTSTSKSTSTDVPQGKHTTVLSEMSPSWPRQPPQQKLVAKYSPWEATRSLGRKYGYQRRMRFLVQALEEEQVQATQLARPIPDFSSGDVLEVRMLVPENQNKQYIYRGVCIARYNKGIRSAFKMYNVYPDGGPVVQHIPLYMPDLISIEVVGKMHAGSRVKKYHLLENESGKLTFQKQVRVFKTEEADVAAKK